MLIAFFCNGLGVFGLRILAGMGLGSSEVNQYLLYFYLGGALSIAIPLCALRIWPSKKEILIGLMMAAASITGTATLALSLAKYHVPGNVAYPISNGGSLFVVVLAGVFLFRERIGKYGVCGCILGILAIVMLSIP
ncbi:MAG: hypothetical protein ACRD3F_08880 [Acidobacteriaceae bacterium]